MKWTLVIQYFSNRKSNKYTYNNHLGQRNQRGQRGQRRGQRGQNRNSRKGKHPKRRGHTKRKQ